MIAKLLRYDAPIWQISFRPFFLVASVFITFALLLWGLILTNSLPDNFSDFHPYAGWFVWHGHEMIFGFVQAVAIGFLLTASRNWAGQPGISSNFIKLLVASWLLARLAWLIPSIPTILLGIFDASTPLLAALGLAQTLRGGEKDHGQGSQRHNWPFVLLLLIFAAIQVVFHGLQATQPQYLSLIMQAAVLMMAAMTLWVSGRVLPFFTRARLQTQPPSIPKSLLTISMASSWLIIPFLVASQIYAESIFLSIIVFVLAIIAAASHSYRLFLFYRKGVITEPMLWSLYCAYAWIIIGYSLIAISMTIESNVPWLHAITIGGLLTMIISMMARISLGHTGRAIIALPGIPSVFIAIQAATLVRITQQTQAGYLITILILLLALSIFLKQYLPILIKPRSDGKPG